MEAVTPPGYSARELQQCDFLTRLGLCGSRATAEEIKELVKTFLHDHLKLTLSEEKTRITHAQTEEAFFLGTILTIGNGGEAKVVLQKTGKC